MSGVRPGSLLAVEIERQERIAWWCCSLPVLAANLATGAALCMAYAHGTWQEGLRFDEQWNPGCGRTAPQGRVE